MLTLYGDAIAAADWATANAIESLPTVFAGRFSANTLNELKRERLRIEAPASMIALEQAEDTLATVDEGLLLMRWTAPIQRHRCAKMVVVINHEELGAVHERSYHDRS